MKGSFLFPPFQCWKQINIQEAFCNIVLGGGGGEDGVTTDVKGVFIQIQNTMVCSKALVLVNCLNTFVHDCWLNFQKGRARLKNNFRAVPGKYLSK